MNMMTEKEETKTTVTSSPTASNVEEGDSFYVNVGSAHLKRELNASQVQLYAVGAAIGTGVFVAMGSSLPTGGPAGLFLGFAVWSIVAYGVNECYGMFSQRERFEHHC